VPDADYAPIAARLAALAEEDPGREICGFVVEEGGRPLRLVPVRNVAGEGDGPPGVPGDARRAFLADPSAHLALSRRLRVTGGRIAAAYHSHVDAPAVLSDVDLEQATCEGVPVHPGVDQVVIGMRGGKVQEIRIFRWLNGAYSGTPIPTAG
jgi:proteasome lid subunit RPN8/RPN11